MYKAIKYFDDRYIFYIDTHQETKEPFVFLTGIKESIHPILEDPYWFECNFYDSTDTYDFQNVVFNSLNLIIGAKIQFEGFN